MDNQSLQYLQSKSFLRQFKSISIIWYREIIIYFRNRLKLFTSIFLPLLILVFLGTGMKTILPTNILPYDFSEVFFSGILGLSVAIMALSSTMTIVWDREFGFLREILVSPISRTDIAVGKILGSCTVALFQGFLLLLVFPYVHIVFSPAIFLATLGVIFLLTYGMSAIGIYFASRLQRTESFSFLTQLVFAPMVFLSGALFPLTAAPVWMIKAASFNPLAYGIDALRWTILHSSFSHSQLVNITLHPLFTCLLVLIIFNIIMTFLSIKVFQKIK